MTWLNPGIPDQKKDTRQKCADYLKEAYANYDSAVTNLKGWGDLESLNTFLDALRAKSTLSEGVTLSSRWSGCFPGAMPPKIQAIFDAKYTATDAYYQILGNTDRGIPGGWPTDMQRVADAQAGITGTTYGMLLDYEAGKIICPVDIDAQVDRILIDRLVNAGNKDAIDFASATYVDTPDFEQAMRQAARAMIVSSYGFYRPDRPGVIDTPPITLTPDQVTLSQQEQAALVAGKEAIGNYYTRVVQVLGSWRGAAMPPAEVWVAAGIDPCTDEVTKCLITQQQELEQSSVQISSDADDKIRDATRAHLGRMLNLANDTAGQVQRAHQGVANTPGFDASAYQAAKDRMVADAQAQIESAKAQFIRSRAMALSAAQAKLDALAVQSPQNPRIGAARTILAQAEALPMDSASPASALAVALMQVRNMIPQIQQDIDDASSYQRRLEDDAGRVAGARAILKSSLDAAVKGYQTLMANTTQAAELAAIMAEQAHRAAVAQTQTAADALARLQARAGDVQDALAQATTLTSAAASTAYLAQVGKASAADVKAMADQISAISSKISAMQMRVVQVAPGVVTPTAPGATWSAADLTGQINAMQAQVILLRSTNAGSTPTSTKQVADLASQINALQARVVQAGPGVSTPTEQANSGQWSDLANEISALQVRVVQAAASGPSQAVLDLQRSLAAGDVTSAAQSLRLAAQDNVRKAQAQASYLESQVIPAQQAAMAAYQAEVDAARAMAQAKIDLAKAQANHSVAVKGSNEAASLGGVGGAGPLIGLGLAALAAKALILKS